MNANDARHLTDEKLKRRVQEALDAIDGQVFGAASCGFSATTYDISGFSSFDVRQIEHQLELLGFRVDIKMERIGVAW